MRICQLVNLLAVLFLVSCSTPKVDKTRDQRVIKAEWLKVPERFALRDYDDNFLTHPFFDVDPFFTKEKRTIQYFVTTPEESAFKYDLNLYSGRLYRQHDFCAMDDIWDSYTGELDKPNFTQGIVPRIYDQNNNPQRIIVFGLDARVDKNKYHPQNFEVGKIVGSFLFDSCESYPCDVQGKWKTTQILLAVNPQSEKFSKVNFLNELRNQVDWPYTKAMLINQDGAFQVGKDEHPAFRISRELNLDETIRYFEKNSKPLKMDELSKWRADCFKLYDDVWNASEKIRTSKENPQEQFYKFFKEFYAKSSDQFYSCGKLVRPATINDDPRRLWFFAYLQAFTNLEKNAFFFSCSTQSWSYNPKIDDHRYFNNQLKELERCRARDFEKSFDQAINGLALMKSQTSKDFRFVEYDSGRGGSHQKIYAWILDDGKTLACKNKKGLFKTTAPKSQFDVFPQDVVWESFGSNGDQIVK